MAGGWKTCHVPRRTWLDSKIDVFLEELAASGMHLDRQRAGELITGQVRAVAALMRVTEATARTYLGDEIIKDMARRMLFEVAGERPGADLMEAPRTVPLPLALVGITVAALAEAMQVRAVASVTLRRAATARTCPVISSPARCRSRCMPDAARSSRNTSILLSSHVRLGTWQVFHPPATELGYSERPVAVTQWSSARYRHWPFCCCSSPVSGQSRSRSSRTPEPAGLGGDEFVVCSRQARPRCG